MRSSFVTLLLLLPACGAQQRAVTLEQPNVADAGLSDASEPDAGHLADDAGQPNADQDGGPLEVDAGTAPDGGPVEPDDAGNVEEDAGAPDAGRLRDAGVDAGWISDVYPAFCGDCQRDWDCPGGPAYDPSVGIYDAGRPVIARCFNQYCTLRCARSSVTTRDGDGGWITYYVEEPPCPNGTACYSSGVCEPPLVHEGLGGHPACPQSVYGDAGYWPRSDAG